MKTGGQNKSCLRSWYKRAGEDVRNGYKYCVDMYVSGKMLSVETIPGMGRRGIKENGGGGKFNYDVFDIV
jgi:hypothetical protein